MHIPKIQIKWPCQLWFYLDDFHQPTYLFDLKVCSSVFIFYPLSHIDARNSFYLVWNSFKQCSELSMHCCFRSSVSKYGTHFESNLCMLKFFDKIVNILPSDNFKVSVISYNFVLRPSKTILWTFFFSWLLFSRTQLPI